ncbi:galactose mutarotase [Candidatus Sumerlaeota bacterium]|nr:galactose mutarotase [Candidatus Sumerlaeota bacterium]
MRPIRSIMWLVLYAVITLAVSGWAAEDSESSIRCEKYGTVGEQDVDIYTLTNSQGAEARITNYGGTVVSLKVPDKNGEMGDVVLGFESVEDYVNHSPYFGCLIGRFGNRIGKGKFTLDGKEYTLAQNNDENHLHGGDKGFDKKVWDAKPMETEEGPALELKYVSPDGEEGYPGTLSVTAVYTLTNDNSLKVDYTATTDQKTICNLTHHSYFNLKDAGKTDMLGHSIMINSDNIVPVDGTLIPTGELMPVAGTPFDFTTSHTIGERIEADNEQLKFGAGYDHTFVLKKDAPGELSFAARVTEPETGRVMEVYTTEPGMQLYSGNFLDGTLTGKGGVVYQRRSAFCLEPQHYPDSPNKPEFPSTVLNPGDTYRNTIVYKFSTL